MRYSVITLAYRTGPIASSRKRLVRFDGIDVVVAVGGGQSGAFMGDQEARAVALADDVKPHHVGEFVGDAVRLEIIEQRKRRGAGSPARSQMFSKSRCRIDLTTEGSALANSIAA